MWIVLVWFAFVGVGLWVFTKKIDMMEVWSVLFENAEIVAASQEEPQDLEGIYRRTIAGEFLHEKREMALRATRFGIQTIITRPEDLSVNTVNKYLELKARGMI